jgi:uroporphyrinogen-III decarboxylase
LCGMQNIMYWQMDQPEVLEALLDVLLEWELNRIDLLLEEGIDVMVHMAWYEGTDFWTPKNYRRLLRPRLQQIIDKVHARDVPLRYIITKGWRPLQRDLMEMGIDCLTGVDPVQDKLDLRQAKQEIGGQISLMGGINAAVTVSMRSEKEIRLAVDQAIEILSPRNGFILYPVDNIACE